MRLAVSRCIAVESSRGWKIDKSKQAHKIDLVISLMMACQAAIEGRGESNFDASWSWVTKDRDTQMTDAEAERVANFQRDFQNYLIAVRNGATAVGYGGYNAFAGRSVGVGPPPLAPPPPASIAGNFPKVI